MAQMMGLGLVLGVWIGLGLGLGLGSVVVWIGGCSSMFLSSSTLVVSVAMDMLRD